MTTFKYALSICGLSQAEAADFLQIKLQSVKDMSAGRISVPAGIWTMLASLFDQIQEAADNAVNIMDLEGIDPRAYSNIDADIPGNELPTEGAVKAAGTMALLMTIQERIESEKA